MVGFLTGVVAGAIGCIGFVFVMVWMIGALGLRDSNDSRGWWIVIAGIVGLVAVVVPIIWIANFVEGHYHVELVHSSRIRHVPKGEVQLGVLVGVFAGTPALLWLIATVIGAPSRIIRMWQTTKDRIALSRQRHQQRGNTTPVPPAVGRLPGRRSHKRPRTRRKRS